MEIVSYIQSRLTFTNCLSSFLIVFSVVQLYYSVRCFRAHRMFFKMNKGKKKIHDRTTQVYLDTHLMFLVHWIILRLYPELCFCQPLHVFC